MVSSNQKMLPIGLLYLSAFINSTIFIQVDPYVRETAICLSINDVRNDTWPSMWQSMTFNRGLFHFKIKESIIKNSSIVEYKLKFFYYNRTTTTKNWNLLYKKDSKCNLHLCFVLMSFLLILFTSVEGFVIFYLYYYFK